MTPEAKRAELRARALILCGYLIDSVVRIKGQLIEAIEPDVVADRARTSDEELGKTVGLLEEARRVVDKIGAPR